MFDIFTSTTDHEERGYDPIRVDEELATEVAAFKPAWEAISVQPHRDNSGIDGMIEVLEALHTVRQESRRLRRSRNVSPAHAFEARYAPVRPGGDPVVSLQYVAGEDRLDGTLERQLRQQYPDCVLERRAPVFLDLEPGVFVAGATLALNRYTLYPIKNVDQPGFEVDPTGSIIQEMVGPGAGPECDVVVQVMFRPEPREWVEGVPNGEGVGDLDKSNPLGGSTPSLRDLAHDLRQPTLEERRRLFTWETIEHPPSAVDKQVATLLEQERGDKGWHLCIRVFAASPDPDEAVRRAAKTAGMFRNFYQHESEQTFVPQPLTDQALRDELFRASNRGFEATGMVKSQREVAGLVNVPRAEFVNTTEMRWALASPGRGVPPGTPRFDFDGACVADASDEERQVAMLDHWDGDAPIWYGRGSRAGTEAGVFPDVLATHQFVGGATGQGKTTLLKNLARQLMNRGHGVLFYDPKGMDADDLVSLVPDGREDDLIYLEVGGDRDQRVGFNFLEPPTDADPDSQVFVDAIESMTDDIAALLEQSSGDQDYWGPRMDQISRNLVRGMAQAGHQCTLLDMYLVLLDEHSRDEYAQMLHEERLDWLSTYASRELADMSQDDIRPVLGRLKELVENQTTREIISHPESTASIRDAVREGRIIVVRDMSSQDNAGRMVATALIRRIWVAVRELTMDPDQDDPPDFYAILDEFNDIAAASSNIDQILSNARSFGLSITAATQDLTAQLDDSILDAIEGQCQTFLSFNPGRAGDAKIIAKQHSPDVDDEDLLNLSKYTLYMRTHDRDEELTHSYKVDAFPPLDEIGGVGRPAAETQALVAKSLERYGAPRRSDERVREQSVFWGGRTTATGDGERDEGDGPARIETLCEAAQTAHIRHETGEGGRGYISLDAIEAAWQERVGTDEPAAAFDDAVETAANLGHLELEQRQDGGYGRLTDTGLQAAGLAQGTGANPKAGKQRHRWLLREAYEVLTRLGCRCDLPRQEDEGEAPDGRAWLPLDPMDAPTPRAVQDRLDQLDREFPRLTELSGGRHLHIEAESSTITRPEQMATNLRKAMTNNRVCLFVVPDGGSDGEAVDYWGRRAEQVLYATARDGNQVTIDYDRLVLAKDVDETGNRVFYNSNKHDLQVGADGWAVRPVEGGGHVRWIESGESLIVRDSEGTELGGFPRLADVQNAAPANVNAWARATDDGYVVRADGEEYRYESQAVLAEEWASVPAPFVPEHELPRTPTEDDFAFLIVPTADAPVDGPQVYAQGEYEPLHGEASENEQPQDFLDL